MKEYTKEIEPEKMDDKQAQKWDISYFFTAKKQTKNKRERKTTEYR